MQPKALIVDDDPSVQKSLGRLFKLKGFTVTAASTVKEALAALNGTAVSNDEGGNAAPAIVILDLNLPDGSGADVLAVIRSRPAALHPHVAVWTGGAPKEVLERIEALRPDATFLKPRDVEKLIEWLESVRPASTPHNPPAE